MQRLNAHHYTFSQYGATLDPGRGVIRDGDLVSEAIDKLAYKFPDALPSIASHGDALPPAVDFSRPVRTVLVAKSAMLDERHPIGQQCLRTGFATRRTTSSTASLLGQLGR